MTPAKIACLMLTAFIAAACQIRSPILLEPKTMVQSARKIPLKAGLKVETPPDHRFSNIWTMTLPIPFVTTKAAFPKMVEADYFQDALMMNLKAHGPFAYIYQAPFDQKDVDVILIFHVQDYLCSNDKTYSHGIQLAAFVAGWVIPFGQPIVQFGFPQEKYDLRQSFTVDVQKPSGEVIKSYDLGDVTDGDSVWLVEQPYANYLWYDSVYIRNLNKTMAKLLAAMDRDAEAICQAAKK